MHRLPPHPSKTSYLSGLLRISLLSFCLLIHTGTQAADEASKEKAKYLQIRPSLVTNFIHEKLRFVKADVALKVRGEASLLTAEEHIPLIKHHLLMLLSSQPEDGVNTAEGQASLKETALETLTDAFSEEGITVDLEEVLFTGFLVE